MEINFDLKGHLAKDKSIKTQMLKVNNNLNNIKSTRKHIQDTCFAFPFAEVYIILSINTDSTCNLVKSGGDEYEFSYSTMDGEQVASNLFKLNSKASGEQQSLDHVPSIKGIQGLKAGDSVQVGFYDSSRQKPYIRSIVKRGSIVVSTPGDGDTIPPPPVFATGMWLQKHGYWWLPNKSRQAINRLDLTPPIRDHYEDEAMAVYHIGPGEGGPATVILFRHPIDFGSNWTVKRGVTAIIDNITGFPPATVDGAVTNLIGNIISDTFDPTGGLYPPGFYIGLKFSDVDWSSNIFTSTYSGAYKNKTTSLFTPDEIGDACRKTIPFKGLVMFNDNNHQCVSILTPHFTVAGANSTTFTGSNHINFVDPGDELGWEQQVHGNTFFLSKTPNATPNVDSVSTDIGYVYYNSDAVILDSNILAYQISLYSGHPHFYFSYKSSDIEDTITDTVIADGTTQNVIVRPRDTDYINILGTNIEVQSFLITSIISATVNGNPDVAATFAGDTLILSTPLSSGDVVDYSVTGFILDHDDQMFNVSGTTGTFHLNNNVPSEGRLVRVNYLNQGNDGEDTGDTTDYSKDCYVVSGTNNVKLYHYFETGDSITITFTYVEVFGDYYSTNELRILEIGGDFSGVRILKTPIDSTEVNPLNVDAADGSRIVEDDLGKFRECSLFFDTATKTYTIAGPTGLIWRSRALLTEAAPSLAKPKAHYTITPWPEENISQDYYNTNPDNLYPPDILIKNREHPWLNFSCAGPYGMQGSWNRWGGVVGDTTQKLRLWKRNTTTYKWYNNANISLDKLLPEDIDGSYPPRIQGMGCTDLFNRIIGQQFQNNGLYYFNKFPNKWPMSKNYKAWIVAAGFIVENFQQDISNASLRNSLDLGWKDTGLTFSAIDPETGVILSQYTIRPYNDEDHIMPLFIDNMARLNYVKEQQNASLEKSIDKYYNHNLAYYPGGVPLPPWDGQNTVTSSGPFATVPWDSGHVYRLYSRLTGYGTEVDRNRGYAGVPSLSSIENIIDGVFFDFRSGVCEFTGYDNPNNNYNLNKSGQPNLTMDELGNIYCCIYMPFWQRKQNIQILASAGSDYPERSNTVTVGGFESYESSYQVSVSFNGNLCTGQVRVTIDGVETSAHVYPGNITGRLVPYTFEIVYVAGTFLRYDETRATESYPGPPIYQIPEVEITVYWKQPVVTSYSEILAPAGVFEYPTFSGFQSTPLTVTGMAISNDTQDYTQDYSVVWKPYVFKLNFDEETKQITEKWRKDVSQSINFVDGIFNSGDYVPEVLALSNLADVVVNWVLPCGRYIFVIKDLVSENPTATDFTSLSSLKSVVEVYHNLNTEPDVFKTINIPNTSSTVLGGNRNWVTHATCDIDSTGREHLTIKLKTGRTITMRFPAEEGDDPEIQNQIMHYSDGEPDFPDNGYDQGSMGRNSDSYYWIDSGNTIKRKDVGT